MSKVVKAMEFWARTATKKTRLAYANWLAGIRIIRLLWRANLYHTNEEINIQALGYNGARVVLT